MFLSCTAWGRDEQRRLGEEVGDGPISADGTSHFRRGRGQPLEFDVPCAIRISQTDALLGLGGKLKKK